jgi:hypothetical protein
MLMLSFVEASYMEKAFLPKKDLFLTCVCSDQVRKHFLCMASVSPNAKSIRVKYLNGDLSPTLRKYTALPYKRQSSIDNSRVRSNLRSQIKAFGFPCIYYYDTDDYVSLNKMRNFYLNLRKHYVVIARRKGDNEEKVALLFDSYSHAVYVSRYFRYTEASDLTGKDFEAYNSWYPYVWVEHMGRPICLFSDISSYAGSYSLGRNWCYYLTCFLRDGFIPNENLASVFGFVYRDKLSKIIHCDSQS